MWRGGGNQGSPVVVWFWRIVQAMEPSQRSQLLHFCTGSARVPASGFANLMGYGGQQHRFTVQLLAGAAHTLASVLNTHVVYTALRAVLVYWPVRMACCGSIDLTAGRVGVSFRSGQWQAAHCIHMLQHPQAAGVRERGGAQGTAGGGGGWGRGF